MLDRKITDEKINKVLQAVTFDNIKPKELSLRKKPKFMSFKKFLQRRAMTEAIMRNDVVESMMCQLPKNATADDINDVMRVIGVLSSVGQLTICAVAVAE